METLPGHRKTFRRYHQPGDIHELTFSCQDRLPLLTNDLWRNQLSRCVDDACCNLEINLAAFVYMPEHVHMLVLPRTKKPDLGSFLACIKQPFSAFVQEHLIKCQSKLLDRLTVEERPGKPCFRFWLEGPGFDRNLYRTQAVEAALNYIHENPVARGLCMQPIDWIWSSARYYLLNPPGQQFEGLPTVHGLGPEVFDKGVKD